MTRGTGLPVVTDRPRPASRVRASRNAPWRAAALVGVHLLIVLHIAHWRLTGRTLSPLEPSEAMELAKHGVVNAGAVFFAAAILVTAFFGRFFCGWGCHVVALQDASRWLLARWGIRPRPLRSRLLALVPLLAFLYMFVWPLAYRLAVGDDVRDVELAFVTSAFWATFPGWAVALATFLVCGFVAVYLLGAKGFCTYGCPYGAIFGLADRFAPGRIRVTDACAGCGHCTAVCSSNVRVHEEVRAYGMVVDPGCMKCLDCVSVCPNQALYFGWGRPALGAPRRAPLGARARLPWWEEATLAAGFAAAFFAFRGLYDAVPFLFALGLGAVVAFLVSRTVRLAREPNARLRRFTLKRAGRVAPAGYGFVVVMAGLGLLWAHSAWLQVAARRADDAYARTAAVRAHVLQADGGAVDDETLAVTEEALARLRRVADAALLPWPRYDLAVAWLHLVRGERAAFEERVARVLEHAPGAGVAHVLAAKNHVLAGRFDEAVAAYRRAIALRPPVANAYLGLGTLWANTGDWARARAVFEAGIAALPDSSELYFNLGLVHAMTDGAARALPFFETAVSLDPLNVAARENLAGMLASMGSYVESVVHYREAARLAPGDAGTHVLLARALLGAGRLEEAEQALGRAASLDPRTPGLADGWAALDAARRLP